MLHSMLYFVWHSDGAVWLSRNVSLHSTCMAYIFWLYLLLVGADALVGNDAAVFTDN